MRQVLFLCTGNYYRSRFAEIVFNTSAEQRNLDLRSDSRGLELSAANSGPLSPHARSALRQLGIEVPADIRSPLMATQEDLQRSSHVIAVKESEHRPLMERRFPKWAGVVEYWNIHDLDCATPEDALPHLLRSVHGLLDRLETELRIGRAS